MPACSAIVLAKSSASLIWFMALVADKASAVRAPYMSCSNSPLPCTPTRAHAITQPDLPLATADLQRIYTWLSVQQVSTG